MGRPWRPLFVVLALAATGAGLSACGGGEPGTSSPPQGEVLRTEGFATVEAMAEASTVIAIGTVTGEADDPVSVPDGASVPAVVFEVDEVVSGEVEPGEELVVRYTAMGGGPRLEDGTRYLLFLDDFWVDPETQAPTGEHVVVGMWSGMYEAVAAKGSSGDAFVKLDPESLSLPETIDEATLAGLVVTPPASTHGAGPEGSVGTS